MKKNFAVLLCLLCCASLLLSGCVGVATGFIKDALSGGSSDTEKPLPTISITTSEPAQTVSPSPSDVGRPATEAPQTSALDTIRENAAPRSLLALLPDENSDIYQSIGTLDYSITSPATKKRPKGSSLETLILVPLKDDVHVLVEELTYNPYLNWNETTKTIYDFNMYAGDCCSLELYMTQDTSLLRITAENNGVIAIWDCTYDAIGGESVIYLGEEKPSAPSFKHDSPYIRGMSAAIATLTRLQSINENNDIFWASVAYSIAQTSDPELYDMNGGAISVPNERFLSYIETLFPRQTRWPDLIDEIVYDLESDSYIVNYFDFGDIAFGDVVSVKPDAKGNGGSVMVNVYYPDEGHLPAYYEVKWTLKKNRYADDPLAYQITEVKRLEGLD